jgi:putative lipoprotein
VRRVLALSLLLPLAACAGGRKAPPGPGEGAVPVSPTPVSLPTVPAPPVPTPTPAPETTASLTGTITYRQRIALTPEAVVQVELRDVSLQDVEAPLVARRIIEKPGQVPISFTLEYDAAVIDPRHTYAVSARITDRGQLQFVTETRVPVITNGAASTAEIVVVPVR